ncbi:MAG: AraC family ligand binding domain-containing protein [Christensenellaceae bacterium]|jgi:transcriptional regulator, araC family
MTKISDKGLLFAHSNDANPVQSTFRQHMHNEYEMLYFIAGDADYVVGSSVYHLRPNDLLFIRPATYHYLKLLSAAPYERFIVNFPEDIVPKNLSGLLGGYRELYNIPKTPDSPIDHIFYGLLQAAENFSQKDARLALIQEINLVLLHLKYASYQGGQPQKRHDVLDNILKFIDENLTSPLNAQVIAEKFYVSSSWISHTFGDFFGIGVSQYINRKKILYAQQLIKSGVPPTKAAEICAYNNYSTFYRQYRQFLAFDPTADKWEEYFD